MISGRRTISASDLAPRGLSDGITYPAHAMALRVGRWAAANRSLSLLRNMLTGTEEGIYCCRCGLGLGEYTNLLAYGAAQTLTARPRRPVTSPLCVARWRVVLALGGNEVDHRALTTWQHAGVTDCLAAPPVMEAIKNMRISMLHVQVAGLIGADASSVTTEQSRLSLALTRIPVFWSMVDRCLVELPIEQ